MWFCATAAEQQMQPRRAREAVVVLMCVPLGVHTTTRSTATSARVRTARSVLLTLGRVPGRDELGHVRGRGRGSVDEGCHLDAGWVASTIP